HALQNTNELLGALPGINGVKTGTTDNAGECLVASLANGNHQVLTVVLGSRDRYADTRALIEFYQANYGWVDGKPAALSVLNRLYAPDGALWHLRATGAPPSVFLQRNNITALQPFRRLQVPPNQSWQAGLTVGVLEWRLGDAVIGVQPLVLW
ncbi:MAG: hypothetical protein M3Q45_01370, partial [Chloroflexota bacterium]|nr:hypothetical protein [Chloroflexota bacterium]